MSPEVAGKAALTGYSDDVVAAASPALPLPKTDGLTGLPLSPQPAATTLRLSAMTAADFHVRGAWVCMTSPPSGWACLLARSRPQDVAERGPVASSENGRQKTASG